MSITGIFAAILGISIAFQGLKLARAREYALVVRPVLLSGAVAVLGERCWWPKRRDPQPKQSPTQPLTTTTQGVPT